VPNICERASARRIGKPEQLRVVARLQQLRGSGIFVSSAGAEMQVPLLNRYLTVLYIAGLLGSAPVFVKAQKTTPPKPVHMVTAEYPESAIREGIEGTVLVMLTIPPDGVPKDVKIAKGFRSDFDKSAIESMQQWRFRPAMRHGKPIEVTVTLEVVFKRPR
jgi:TonB family protein